MRKFVALIVMVIMVITGCGYTMSAGSSAGILSIQTDDLPTGTVYEDYETTLSAKGGVAPYTWELVDTRALTYGLSILEEGIISGRPYFNGTWDFTVKVNDSAGNSATKQLSIEIQGDLHLLISEVFYDTPGTESEQEWIEIYNPFHRSIDLAGYTISDNNQTAEFPLGTSIPGNGTLVWARDRDGFYDLYNFAPDLYGLTLSLSNSGDVLVLKNPDGETIDNVGFEVEGWESVRAEETTIERQSLYDTDTPEDWGDSGDTGNPGIFSHAPTQDQAPVARAGKDLVIEGLEATLDGSDSFDPDNDALFYSWDVGLTGANPVFAPALPGFYSVRLTVSDGILEDYDTILIYFLPDGEKITGSFFYNTPIDAHGIHTELVNIINRAQVRVDVAVYDMDHSEIIEALKEAWNRGVEVRVVTDDDNYRDPGPFAELEVVGINVERDNRSSFCHHKFFVIDNRYLWTGSYNPTDSGTTYHANSALLIDSAELAGKFTEEFEEMFTRNRFGTDKQNTSSGTVEVNGHQVGWAFSPTGDTRAKILSAINSADTSIYFCIFSFTDDDISQALIN
ncbi:MAG: lamin tail domain-containing protein, partial [Candidatus Eremiobacteraeota bacterium]|nr:lamin tail domain-containing protein [Candidatus Eremiobacteraeota bacterium]